MVGPGYVHATLPRPLVHLCLVHLLVALDLEGKDIYGSVMVVASRGDQVGWQLFSGKLRFLSTFHLLRLLVIGQCKVVSVDKSLFLLRQPLIDFAVAKYTRFNRPPAILSDL